MMLPPIANETITIETPVLVSDHGAQVPDYDQPPAQVLQVHGCSVQPAGGSEDRTGRDQQGALYTVFAPPGTALGAFDRVRIARYPTPLRGTTEPQLWTNNALLNHVILDLAAWEG